MSQGKQCVRIPVVLAGMVLASAPVSSNPDDVIGKPFRISESVKSYCAMQPPAMMCVAFGPQLAEFMAEKREASWAAPLEMLIEKSMRVGGVVVPELPTGPGKGKFVSVLFWRKR